MIVVLWRVSVSIVAVWWVLFVCAMEQDVQEVTISRQSCTSDVITESTAFGAFIAENEIIFADERAESLIDLLPSCEEKSKFLVNLELKPIQTVASCFSFAKKLYDLLAKQLGAQGFASGDIASLLACCKKGLVRFEDQVLCTGVVLPEDAQIDVLGDLHGDPGPIHALLEQLSEDGVFDPKTFALTKLNHYIVVLGDMIDRGPASLAVLFYLSKLVAANPGRIFLLRGNHETFFNPNCTFIKDIFTLAPGKQGPKELFDYFYNKLFVLLPQVLFIRQGARRFAFVHGGIDHLITSIAQEKINAQLDQLPTSPTGKSWVITLQNFTSASPYLWNDMQDGERVATAWDSYRGSFSLSQQDVFAFLQKFSVDALFRGHQQDNIIDGDESRHPFVDGRLLGVYSRWHDTVLTLNVAPNTGDFDLYDEYFTTIGSWVRLKKNTGVGSDSSGKETHSISLESAPEFLLQGLYFDPKTHKKVFARFLHS